MDLLPFQIAAPFFLGMVLVEFWYERKRDHKTYRLNNALSNLSAGLMEAILGTSSHLLLLFMYSLSYENFRLFSLEPGWWVFLFLFAGYEFCYYWKHRMGHEINFLWGGHMVHHQSEDFNFTAALRLSATSPVWGIPFYLPMALAGFSPVQFVLVQIISHVYQFFIHTEHIGKLPRWVELIFNTPSHHRVHHGRDPKYIDRNYGSVLIIWDRIFRTFQEEEETPAYGVTDPLTSWDPVWANVSYYVQLFHWIKRCRTLRDAVRILFGRPGNLPDYLRPDDRRQKALTAVPPAKYDAKPVHPSLAGYAAVQFVLGLLATMVLLVEYESMPRPVIFFYTLWGLWVISMVGVLLESRSRRVLCLEAMKLISFPAVLFILYRTGCLPHPVIFLISIPVSAGCLIFLLIRCGSSGLIDRLVDGKPANL